MKKKKLAIITTHPIQYNAPLFKELAKSQVIEVKVFYTWGEISNKKYDPGFGKEIAWDIPLLEGYDFLFVKNISKDPGSHHFNGIDNPSLISDIQTFKPNAILVYGWNFKSHLKVVRHFKNKIPLYFRGDSHLLNEKPGLKKLLRKIVLVWVYSHIDFAFYVGLNNKQYFLKYGLKESQLIHVPHIVDNERFEDNQEYIRKAFDIRLQMGISKNDTVILFAGKLEDNKNPVLLINAFLKLNTPNLHLVIIGNGSLESDIKNRATGFPNIIFMDFQNQSQMPIVYRIGDIFCLPSKSETWGLAINEAMVCGLPVIVSDRVGCAVDLVKEGLNGFIFKSGDEMDLVQKFNRMTQKDLPEMGMQSRKIIATHNIKSAVITIEQFINAGN